MVFLYIWTIVASLVLLVLWLRFLKLQSELARERQDSDVAARTHRDTVTALRTSELRDSMVLESIDELVYRLKPLGEAWQVEFVSSRVQDLLGYTPGEAAMLGVEVIHPDDR